MPSFPIIELPEELLLAIFLFHVSRPLSKNDRRFEHSISLASLDLSQVCRLWRRLLLSTPPLWSFVRINTGVHDYWLPVLSLLLERSGDCLLDLAVKLSDSYMSRNAYIILDNIFGALVPHSHRWNIVDISQATDYYYHGAYELKSFTEDLKFPHLESASFTDFRHLLPYLRRCPTLQYLHAVKTIRLPKDNPRNLSDLRELTLLDASYQSSDIWECLIAFPHLTSLYMDVHANAESLRTTTTIAHLPNLINLDIPPRGILNFLTCPHITTLHIRCNSRGDGSIPELPNFLAETPSLQTLKFTPSLNTRAFFWLLDPVVSNSRLSHLHVVFQGISTYPLPELNTNPVLPCLRNVTITFDFPHNGTKWPYVFVEWFAKYLPRSGEDDRRQFPSLGALKVEVGIWGHQPNGVEEVKRKWMTARDNAPERTVELELKGGITDVDGHIIVPICDVNV
ncbi:hypothetical protein DL96DRAFT_1637794 [Flagelloscypha sp. PMI_526]|nr:hypothetical protein DL96DRAFT_1637794 [Flagelloscypha sp. PMI_526]